MKGFTLVKNLSAATTVIRNSSGRTTWERIWEKPFNCYHCDKKFIQKDDLRVHERLHTGEKPFNCYHCDKKFVQKDNLREHLRTTIQLPPLWQEIRKMEDKRTRLRDKEKFDILLASKQKGIEHIIQQLKSLTWMKVLLSHIQSYWRHQWRGKGFNIVGNWAFVNYNCILNTLNA